MSALRHVKAWVAIGFALIAMQAYATLAVNVTDSADGWNGSIAMPYEEGGAGTADVSYRNSTGANYFYKREACGGDVSTYLALPTSGSASLGGLTVSALNTGSNRVYRFSGIPKGSAQAFCFVSADGYMTATLTSTAIAVTPTPVITNLRIVADAALTGGKKLCVDFTPTNPVITTFDWLENGVVKSTGSPSSLSASYVCWNRNIALVEGQSYAVQLRYNGANSSILSNTLNLTIPFSLPPPGSISTINATANDTSIPTKIRISWSASSNASTYNVWRSDGVYVAIGITALTFLDTPPSAGASYGYVVQGVNATSSGAWSVRANGVAASTPVGACTTVSVAAPIVRYTGNNVVRVTASGVTNATQMSFMPLPSDPAKVSGYRADYKVATNAGGGVWYADIPVTGGYNGPLDAYYTVSSQVVNSAGVSNSCAPVLYIARETPSAAFVSMSLAGMTGPSTLTLIAGKSYPALFTFKNLGRTPWLHAGAAGESPLVKLSTGASSGWFGATSLVFSGAGTAPNATATATGTILITAAGSYSLQVQPIEDSVGLFNAAAPAVAVTVIAAPTAATNVTASDGTFGDKVRVAWTSGANLGGQNVYRAAPGTAWPSGSLTALPAGWTQVCTGLPASGALTCDDATATRGVVYDYRVWGWSGAAGSTVGNWDQGGVSVSDSGYAELAITGAPQNFTATTNLSDRIRLNWSALAGASKYTLYRLSGTGGQGTSTLVAEITGTTYDDVAPARGKETCYKLYAANNAGEGPTFSQACGMKTALTAPTLTATRGTVTGITRLTWPSATGYTADSTSIWRLNDTSNLAQWELLGTWPGSAGTYDDGSTRGSDVNSDFYRIDQTDASGGVTGWSMTSTTNFSLNIASGYANLAPTSLTANISATSDSASALVALAVVDPNVIAAQPESFVFSVVTQPPTGSGACSISGSSVTWSPPVGNAFAGSTSCTVRVTDRGGATIDGVVTVTVAAFVPSPPTRVSATDGTVTSAVTVTWAVSTGASSYQVLRNGVAVGTVSSTTFSDASISGVSVYSYSLLAISASGGRSVASGTDTGYANVAPVLVGNPVLAFSAAGIGNPTVVSVPYADANSAAGQAETFAFTVAGLPASAGAITVNSAGVLTYTPPTTGATVADTRVHSLTVTLTDKAGAVATGNVALTIVGFDNAGIDATNITPPVLIATSVENTNVASIWPNPLGSQFVQFKNTGTTTWADTYRATYTLTNAAGLSLSGTSSLNTMNAAPAAFSAQGAGTGTAQFQPSLSVNKLVSGNALGAATLRVQMVNGSGVNFGAPFNIDVNVRALPSCAQATLTVDQAVVRAVTGTLGIKLSGSQFADATTFVVTHVATGRTSKRFASTLSGTDFVGQLDLAALTTGSPLFGAFIVNAIMTNSVAGDGQTCSKTASFQREALAPTNVVATKGTVTGAVKVSWTGIPSEAGSYNASAYDVLACSTNTVPTIGYADTAAGRSVSPSTCSIIGSVGADIFTFTNTLSDVTEIHRWYVVAAREGPASASTEGWPNLAPTNTRLVAGVNAFGLGQQLPMALQTDANTGEQFTISLSDPVNGPSASSAVSRAGVQVVLTASGLTYNPVARPLSGAVSNGVAPSVPGVMGTDSFTYWATDRTGESIMGTAQLTVCPYPSVAISAVDTTANPIRVAGTVTRLACNGATNARFSLSRLGSSVTAGSTTGAAAGEFAAQSVFDVQGPAYESGLSFGSSVINRSGRYALTTIVTDATGATAASDAFPIDVACGDPQWSVTSQRANFKRGVLAATTSITQNDICQAGLTYGLDVVRLTEATKPTVSASISLMNPEVGGVLKISEVGANTITNWTGAVPNQTSPMALRLQSFKADGIAVASKLSPLSVTCPDPFVSSAAVTARSNLESVEVIVAIAPCAVRVSSVTLTAIGAAPITLTGELVAGAASAAYRGDIPYPANDGVTTASITMTLADGRVNTTALRIIYDAKAASPLYSLQILRGTPGSTTTDSIGRVLLAPPRNN